MNLVVLQRNDALKAFFPFHDEERRARLYALWVNKYAAPSSQPLDEVKVGQMLQNKKEQKVHYISGKTTVEKNMR